MNKNEILAHSSMLFEAWNKSKPTKPISKSCGTLNMETAYEIQENLMATRVQNGERVIGYKMGLTSKAKMDQMGLRQPIFGVLTSVMEVESQSEFSMGKLIHPKAEPEVAFRISRDIRGIPTKDFLINSISEIYPAIEILDSRYLGFKYFSLPDVVADNSSSSHFVIGAPVFNARTYLQKDHEVKFYVNGKLSTSGNTRDVLSNPLNSLWELCKLLDDRNRYLPKNSVVLTGAITTATMIKPGDIVTSEIEGLGIATVRIVK